MLIKAECYCNYFDIKIACHGFKTVEPLNSKVISRDSADVCSLVNPIYSDEGGVATFTYAWRQPFNFTKISFTMACS